MHAGPTRHRVALAIALAGVAVSVVTLTVHGRLTADAGYTSFCNVNDVVNCDVVLGSRWGRLFGVSVSAWAIAAFAVGAVLALPGAVRGGGGDLADLALIALASGSLGFAAVLAVVSLAVLRHACVLCLTLDAVIVAWVVAVLPLTRRFAGETRAWWRRPPVARAAAALALVLAAGGGTVAAVRAPGPATSIEDVRAREPRFYEMYVNLPVRAPSEVEGGARHAKGPADAPITIVEFSDFQCPACRMASPDLRHLIRSRSDVRLVFRHFPLDAACNDALTHSLHPDACLAAVASECAGAQGRFWEYHDLLFANQQVLDRDSLFRYARELRLDVATFRRCLDDPATRAIVAADIAAGQRVEVASTPTLFINGRHVQGALEPAFYEYALVIEKQGRDRRASRHGG